MKTSKYLFFLPLVFIWGCDKTSDPINIVPLTNCKTDALTEDTSRKYYDLTGAEFKLYNRTIYARFNPNISDTNLLNQKIAEFNLRKPYPYENEDGQITALLCIPADKKVENYFTPWGKENICNFGNDSIVEYSFGVFDSARSIVSGVIWFKFDTTTSQGKIDSLFSNYGLRFVYTTPDLRYKKRYYTVLTHNAKKNPFDIAVDLKKISYIVSITPQVGYVMWIPILCN